MRISDWSSDVCSSDLIGKHEVEAAQHGTIENVREVCRRDNDRRTRIFVEKLQKAVKDAPGFADVVPVAPRRRDGVDFIEKIDAACRFHRIENHPKLLGGFAHELRDEAMKHHREERKLDLAGKPVGDRKSTRLNSSH